MSVSDDRTFYERRIQEELTRAANENEEKLRMLHREWASLYATRLSSILNQNQ